MSSTISTSRFNSSRRSPWSDDPSFLGLHWDGYMEIIANGYMRSSLACEYDQVEAGVGSIGEPAASVLDRQSWRESRKWSICIDHHPRTNNEVRLVIRFPYHIGAYKKTLLLQRMYARLPSVAASESNRIFQLIYFIGQSAILEFWRWGRTTMLEFKTWYFLPIIECKWLQPLRSIYDSLVVPFSGYYSVWMFYNGKIHRPLQSIHI